MTDQPTKADRLAEARQSYTGSRLTDQQFQEAWQIAGILHREIHHSGSFRDKLTDYAHAFARSEKFDAVKGETILRDIFAARYDQSLNQLREGLMAREAALQESSQNEALAYAHSIAKEIENTPDTPFYQAYDRAAVEMARAHDITEAGAKSLMKESYRADTGRELYEDGKAAEQEHHTPARAALNSERRKPAQCRARSGPRR